MTNSNNQKYGVRNLLRIYKEMNEEKRWWQSYCPPANYGDVIRRNKCRNRYNELNKWLEDNNTNFPYSSKLLYWMMKKLIVPTRLG